MGASKTPANKRKARSAPAGRQIDAGFLRQLQQHVAAREIELGIAAIQSHDPLIQQLVPTQKNAAQLLAQLAIWTDIGYSGPPLNQLLRLFKDAGGLRSQLPIVDYLCLRIAEGMTAM